MTADFSERFCQHFKVPPGHYRPALLRRALYPAARWLGPVLRFFYHDFLALDLSYIDAVGRMRRLRDLATESHEFSTHPGNRGFLRGTLRLRVSVGRMHDIVNTVMNDVVV